MRFLLRYWPGLIAVALGATFVAYVAYSMGTAAGDRRAAKAELALAHVQRDAAQQVALAEAKAREAERREVQRLVEIEAENTSRLERIESEAETRTAGLRAGNLRLRREIAALATARVSGEAAATAELEAAAQRGAELVAAAVGVGAKCDARIDALIRAYEAPHDAR